MDDFQFLKEELSSPKFNKRIFYAKNSNKYIDLIEIDLFIDKYIPYITNYVLKEENTEEVLTEYSKTFINFLKYLGKECTYLNYINNSKDSNTNPNQEKTIKYKDAISLIIKCFFDKFFVIDDEILKEISINNIKELLLEIDNYSLVKSEIEKYFNFLTDNNKSFNENKDINEENEVLFLIYSLYYPFIENDEQTIINYCNKLKFILNKNNNQLKKKRVIIQNITNIIPFIRKSIDKIKEISNENDDNKIKIIKHNRYILKEVLSSLNCIMEEKNLIISVTMNYLCEIIIIYIIKNMTEIILFYEEYLNILSCQEIDLIVNNFISKLSNFLNNESALSILLTWRIKVSYIENICRLNKLVLGQNPNYYNEYFSSVCQKILENKSPSNFNNNPNFNNNINNDADLKICVLNHIDFLILRLPIFLQIFTNTTSLEHNIYIRSNLAIALNKILNNEQFYKLNDNNTNYKNLMTIIFNMIQNILEKDKYEVKYYLLSSFEFNFFNLIQNDEDKMIFLNRSIKLIILSFETITEWRIRYNIYNKFDQFISDENNFLKIIQYYEKEKVNKNNLINEMIKNIRYLIQLFFKDKANIIRTSCLQLINNIINIQKNHNINNDCCLIRIKEELIKFQYSLFIKNNNFEEGENFLNNIPSLEINKNYWVKIYFLDSIKKFFPFYSKEEKNIIKDIISLIKNSKKYSDENVANNKINQDIELILEKLKLNISEI